MNILYCRCTCTFDSLSGNVSDLAEMTFPWLQEPAGLSSGGVQRAAARGTPVDDSRDYYPSGVLPHRPRSYPHVDPPMSLRTSDISGTKPRLHPIITTSETKTPIPAKRCTSPLKPQYQLPSHGSPLSATAPCSLRMLDVSAGGGVTSSGWSPRSRPSTSLETSDIFGARRKETQSFQRGEWAKFTDRESVNDISVSQICFFSP